MINIQVIYKNPKPYRYIGYDWRGIQKSKSS